METGETSILHMDCKANLYPRWLWLSPVWPYDSKKKVGSSFLQWDIWKI